jgi:putative peptidoglycan lipid II flippase
MVDKARRLLSATTRKQTVGNAALIISGAYLASQLLGVFRTRLLVSHFGVGPQLSAYSAAFRLPEFLFTLLVSGAFAVSFIPVLAEHLRKEDQSDAWRITSSLLNLLVLGTIAGGVFIFIFADPLTTLITPGFDHATHELTVNLTRIMAVTPVLFAVSSVLGSVQQAFNRFMIFSLAGVFYNFGIILGILTLTPSLGIYGAAWGVVLGVVLQALLQWAGLYGLGFKYRPTLNVRLRGVRQTLTLMVPRSIDQGIDQINYSVETIIGSTINSSAIAQFALANNLKNVPLVLIGSSISTAVFPRLAARAAAGEREKLIESFVRTARLILFLAIPSALFTVVARGYIVRLVFGFGDQATANTLGWFAGTIVFASLFMLVSRVYFSMQDTKTPLYTSLGSIPLNIALSFILARAYGVVGLAMAASFVAVLETLVLMALLRIRRGNFGEMEILRGAALMTVAATLMLAVIIPLVKYVLPLYAGDKGIFILAPKFSIIALAAALSYLAPCHLFGLPESKLFLTRLRGIITKPLSLI